MSLGKALYPYEDYEVRKIAHNLPERLTNNHAILWKKIRQVCGGPASHRAAILLALSASAHFLPD